MNCITVFCDHKGNYYLVKGVMEKAPTSEMQEQLPLYPHHFNYGTHVYHDGFRRCIPSEKKVGGESVYNISMDIKVVGFDRPIQGLHDTVARQVFDILREVEE